MPRAKNTRAKPAPARRPTTTANGRQVKIRMYNVGFGDAFLVNVPVPGGRRKILFDCGSIEAAKGVEMKSVVEQIIHDVGDEDGVPRIDVVVATHRHKDHVSGFGNTAWDDVEVKEVWMPWTEHPTDAEARRIRDTQSRLALGLKAGLDKRVGGLGAAELRYQNIVDNALMLSNEAAMRRLHSGFIGEPRRRFLPGKDEDRRTFTTDALPGVRIHVMGPSRSRDVIRDMDPPKGKSFLRMDAATAGGSESPPAPFAQDFRLPLYTGTGVLPDQDLEEIQKAGEIYNFAVAVALDKAVNGTSLMIMLEIAGTYLLFPGDAQWGTWNAAIQDPEWNELLQRVAFYKIGHHGSHNATPKEFVEEMIPNGMWAMASTLTRRIWPDIPRKPLLLGLAAEGARVARSDQEELAKREFQVEPGVIEARIPL